MCARRFLIVIFLLTLLVVAGAFAVYQFGGSVLRKQALPTIPFKAPPVASGPDYVRTGNWLNLPDTVPPGPASWTPRQIGAEAPVTIRAATFYIHPTTYLERDRWNAPLDHAESQSRAQLFVRSQASVFGGTRVYAPKYRQAAFGAFLDTGEDATKALNLAYSDVLRAFDRFLAEETSGPIILAGHSQGSLHLTHLLRDRVAKDPALARRIVAAYVIGWPVSAVADVPRMGLGVCQGATDTRCIISFQSFAEPANTGLISDVYEETMGFTGERRRRRDLLCWNPLGTPDQAGAPGVIANFARNAGTLRPTDNSLSDADLVPGAVGAMCRDGFLTIAGPEGKLPDLGPYVLPGNNYHVYDYALFWANLRADARQRLASWRP